MTTEARARSITPAAAADPTVTGGRISCASISSTSIHAKSDPMDPDFNYAKAFNSLDLKALKKDLER